MASPCQSIFCSSQHLYSSECNWGLHMDKYGVEALFMSTSDVLYESDTQLTFVMNHV